MANILINELCVTGFDLLSDTESYLNEINDNEIDLTRGGFTTSPVCASLGVFALSFGVSVISRKIHDHNKGLIARL